MADDDGRAEAKLLLLRLQVIDLLKDWGTKQFEDKENVFDPYLDHLFVIAYQGIRHEDTRGVKHIAADLGVLKDLLHKLKVDVEAGRGSYIRFQMAVVNAHKKLGMLLQEVDRKLKEGIIIPDDAFQKWIDEVLVKEDWNGYLDFVDRDEFLVLHKAKASGVQVEQLTVTREDIDVANLDDIEKRLKMYRKELENAYEMPQDNVDCIAHGPSVCESIEQIMSKLKEKLPMQANVWKGKKW